MGNIFKSQLIQTVHRCCYFILELVLCVLAGAAAPFCEALDKCVLGQSLHPNVTISLDQMSGATWHAQGLSRSVQERVKCRDFKILFYVLLYFLLPETLCWRSCGSLCLLIESIAGAQLFHLNGQESFMSLTWVNITVPFDCHGFLWKNMSEGIFTLS